jgi:hypothetical protein
MGEIRNQYKILEGYPEGKRPLRNPRRRREDNNRMDFTEIEKKHVDCVRSARDDQWQALMKMETNPPFP